MLSGLLFHVLRTGAWLCLKTEHSRSQCNIPRGWLLITTYSTMGSSFFFHTDLAVSARTLTETHSLEISWIPGARGGSPLRQPRESFSVADTRMLVSKGSDGPKSQRREASFPRGRQLQNTPGPSLDSEHPGTKALHLRYHQSLSHHPGMPLLHVYRGL